MQRDEISSWKKVVNGWLHKRSWSSNGLVAGGFSNPATQQQVVHSTPSSPISWGKRAFLFPAIWTITSPDAMCSGKRANIFQHKSRDIKRKRPSHPGALCPQSLPILTNTLSIPALRILSNERTVNTNPAVLLRPLPSTLYW